MQSKLNPYISFKKESREAMVFYKTVFGGKLVMTTFGEAHASQDPADENNLMHAMLIAENGMTLMASDTPGHMEYKPGKNISISLSGENEEELKSYWEKLSAGAQIGQPLVKAPWGDTFGMLTDKFGIGWMVNIAGPKA
ncbi:VOC family protein [soil metagenome]